MIGQKKPNIPRTIGQKKPKIPRMFGFFNQGWVVSVGGGVVTGRPVSGSISTITVSSSTGGIPCTVQYSPGNIS